MCLIEASVCCRYTLEGRIRHSDGKVRLSFELEICYVGPTKAVGIRRKRLNGDVWGYKQVLEQVLALTSLNQQTKSK